MSRGISPFYTTVKKKKKKKKEKGRVKGVKNTVKINPNMSVTKINVKDPYLLIVILSEINCFT